jgi:hypothetical protein
MVGVSGCLVPQDGAPAAVSSSAIGPTPPQPNPGRAGRKGGRRSPRTRIAPRRTFRLRAGSAPLGAHPPASHAPSQLGASLKFLRVLRARRREHRGPLGSRLARSPTPGTRGGGGCWDASPLRPPLPSPPPPRRSSSPSDARRVALPLPPARRSGITPAIGRLPANNESACKRPGRHPPVACVPCGPALARSFLTSASSSYGRRPPCRPPSRAHRDGAAGEKG